MEIDLQDAIYNKEYFSGYGHNLDSEYETLPFIRHVLSELADFLCRRLVFDSHIDVGCAMGFMTEKMRELGKNSYGCDISNYAISRAADSIKDRVWVQDISQTRLNNKYDLVTCVETIEHIERKYENRVMNYLASATEKYIYFSSEENYDEPTHVNVRPRHEWVNLWAAKGFKTIRFDYPFIKHGLLLEKF